MKRFLMWLTERWPSGPGCSRTNQSMAQVFEDLPLGNDQSDRLGLRVVPFAIQEVTSEGSPAFQA